MTIFLSGWYPTEFSHISLCLISAYKLQEHLIPWQQQECLVENIGMQQKVEF